MATQLSLSYCQVNIESSPRHSKFTAHLTSEQDNGMVGTGGMDRPQSVSSGRAQQLSLYQTVCPKIMFWGVLGKSVAGS